MYICKSIYIMFTVEKKKQVFCILQLDLVNIQCMFLLVAGFCFIQPLFAPPPTTNSQASKALSFENCVIIFQFKC